MQPTGMAADSLNASQQRHLLANCRHADKLLAEIEAILAASTSQSPFPRYKPDIAPAQAKIVRDYVARIRARIVRLLESQEVPLPEAQFGSLHSIRVTLGFVGIAFDECRARNMAGYGELADGAGPDLDGAIDEMKSLIGSLNRYLAQDLGQDLEARLRRLRTEGSEVGLVRQLERIIGSHGMVEFRGALAHVIERLEADTFEIAFFGRVSSGKSSLLNRILGRDVLPVGVTPVTAVPTRVAHGPVERAVAWFAGRDPEAFEIARLPEFATEQLNPANEKLITRILVELPSAALREGIVYVDTPGLGSLAAAGAAETLAYLPRCDLGVVLIDAGSTLTGEDLATIRMLYEAAIPAMVVMSKCDLLEAGDLERSRCYVAAHLATELGLNLPVHAVSAMPAHAAGLEEWFTSRIVPLHERHAELSRASLERKIGALRAAVMAALHSKLGPRDACKPTDDSGFLLLESELRKAAGRFSAARSEGLRIADEIRAAGDLAIAQGAAAVVDVWRRNGADGVKASAVLASAIEQSGAALARPIAAVLEDAAQAAADVLARCAAALAMDGAPDANEFHELLKEMPRPDAGVPIDVSRGRFSLSFGTGWAVRKLEGQLRTRIGGQVHAAFAGYGKRMESWVQRTVSTFQARFDSYADTYRAQLERLTGGQRAAGEEAEAIRRDIESIAAREVE
jgi:GTP-binding protein EngB required for normal cell division